MSYYCIHCEKKYEKPPIKCRCGRKKKETKYIDERNFYRSKIEARMRDFREKCNEQTEYEALLSYDEKNNLLYFNPSEKCRNCTLCKLALKEAIKELGLK